MVTGSATRKRKRVFLSIEDKTEVMDMLDHGISSTAIVANYGIAGRTVSDIKKSKCECEMSAMGMSLKAKTMRLGDNYHNNYIIASEASFLCVFNGTDFLIP